MHQYFIDRGFAIRDDGKVGYASIIHAIASKYPDKKLITHSDRDSQYCAMITKAIKAKLAYYRQQKGSVHVIWLKKNSLQKNRGRFKTANIKSLCNQQQKSYWLIIH